MYYILGGIEEATIKAKLQFIKSIMINYDVTVQKAMQDLNIEEGEQDKYLDLLGLKALI